MFLGKIRDKILENIEISLASCRLPNIEFEIEVVRNGANETMSDFLKCNLPYLASAMLKTD